MANLSKLYMKAAHSNDIKCKTLCYFHVRFRFNGAFKLDNERSPIQYYKILFHNLTPLTIKSKMMGVSVNENNRINKDRNIQRRRNN